MPPEKVKMTNPAAWGKLVKTWATKQDHVKNGSDFSHQPTTIQEFEAQANLAGAGPIIPAAVTSIVFIQGDVSTLVVRLPPAAMILAAEEALAGGDAYALPNFYSDDAFGGKEPQIADTLDFHDKRIGEYTINNCQ